MSPQYLFQSLGQMQKQQSLLTANLKILKKCHFGQAHGTPFTISPLSQYLDWAGNLPDSEAVLNSTFMNDELCNL
eukprot:4047771-Ditylum_brightwellii.AAC.1